MASPARSSITRFKSSAIEAINSKQVRKQKTQASTLKKGHVGRYKSHFTGNSNMEPKCCFCEETEEHIGTNGPKGKNLCSTLLVRNF